MGSSFASTFAGGKLFLCRLCIYYLSSIFFCLSSVVAICRPCLITFVDKLLGNQQCFIHLYLSVHGTNSQFLLENVDWNKQSFLAECLHMWMSPCIFGSLVHYNIYSVKLYGDKQNPVLDQGTEHKTRVDWNLSEPHYTRGRPHYTVSDFCKCLKCENKMHKSTYLCGLAGIDGQCIYKWYGSLMYK